MPRVCFTETAAYVYACEEGGPRACAADRRASSTPPGAGADPARPTHLFPITAGTFRDCPAPQKAFIIPRASEEEIQLL
ncbi:hypothetical protein SKAU_G00006810 [Synaphobranchus kaupii]|uniref:Uncharacterized protein n=1 Tax=Synaphobranchus kaupii TaxID=118154 RepID=A0A9Q1JBS5_SYNKA|nr:hypothetical protein SKAU_G00006810 [Synaphobranchus kaupii]